MAPFFGRGFPLVYRVLVLVGSGIFAWATNLHVLCSLGIDTAYVLDIRPHGAPAHPTLDEPPSPQPLSPLRPSSNMNVYSHPATLYPPLYRLCMSYAVTVTASWLTFRYLSGADPVLMDEYKFIPALTAIALFIFLISPLNLFHKKERMLFLASLRRCIFSSLRHPIYFSDIILADVFTSFAKVIGDIWVAACMLSPSGSLSIIPVETGVMEWAVPFLMSLPYLIRWRQCVVEYFASNRKATRSLYNAIKYATAFPVIFLSAAQRIVGSEQSIDTRKGVWYGGHPLFRLWLLAVLINSMFSFWWDVTNDWGLELLQPASWAPSLLERRTDSPSVLELRSPTSPRKRTHQRSNSRTVNSMSEPNEPTMSSESYSTAATHHPRGLRSPLLFRDPIIYYLAIGFNLVLRFTWSLRLSSHLHMLTNLQSGIFLMEALELIRRWVWVYFRVEWEAVRKGATLDEIELRFRGTEEGRPLTS